MTIYITPNNQLHDDADGFALTLPSWPKDACIATQAEIDAILNPPETPEQIIARLESVIESHIDFVIKSMGYVSLERLVVYQNSTNAKWKAEALGAPVWVTAIWETALSIMNDVQSGLREVPTEDELLALMPKLEDFVLY